MNAPSRLAKRGPRIRRPRNNDLSPRDPERYDYPAKNTVRAHIVPFSFAGIAPDDRARVRIWCMPSAHLGEINAYRQRGFSDAQLQAFEWSPEVATELASLAPDLPLYRGPLGAFLCDPTHRNLHCDAANLDFDGSLFTFQEEICAVIARMRMDVVPCLQLTSFSSRDRAPLAESIRYAMVIRSMLPAAFSTGQDILRDGNESSGLHTDNGPAWHVVLREIGLYLLLARAFGGRSYGRDDTRAAATFRERFDATLGVIRRKLRPQKLIQDVQEYPNIDVTSLRDCFARRTIPCVVPEWLRFTYYTPHRCRMMTWMFRFRAAPNDRIPVLEWVEQLLRGVPPLHVIDHNGAVMGTNDSICRWCPESARHEHGGSMSAISRDTREDSVASSVPPVRSPPPRRRATSGTSNNRLPAPVVITESESSMDAREEMVMQDSIGGIPNVPMRAETVVRAVTAPMPVTASGVGRESVAMVIDAIRRRGAELVELLAEAGMGGPEAHSAIDAHIADAIAHLEPLLILERAVADCGASRARLISVYRSFASPAIVSAPPSPQAEKTTARRGTRIVHTSGV